jgi:hypothetical protein
VRCLLISWEVYYKEAGGRIDGGVEKGVLVPCRWFSHYGKLYGNSAQMYSELPYDLAIPLLGTCPKEIKSLSQGDISPRSL